jgi:hypothetical protein
MNPNKNRKRKERVSPGNNGIIMSSTSSTMDFNSPPTGLFQKRP